MTGYRILRQLPLRGESVPSIYVPDTGSTATSYMDEAATVAGERYNYQVSALMGDHESHVSNLATVTIPQSVSEPSETGPLEADTPAGPSRQLSPQGLVAEAGAGFVQLRWNAPLRDAESVTGYEILRRRVNLGETALEALVTDTGALRRRLLGITLQTNRAWCMSIASRPGAAPT